MRPEVTGRVVLGAPDDYVSSLLSPVLRRFSNLYPHVEIEIVCAQSTALAPMLADNKIDLAFVTRDRKLRGEFVRSEPMVWVGASVDTPVLACNLIEFWRSMGSARVAPIREFPSTSVLLTPSVVVRPP